MNHNDKLNAIRQIRPNAVFVLSGDKLQWLDETQSEPTDAEINKGFVAYQAAAQTEEKANATAKAALLAQLGITEEQAKLLLS